MNSNNNSGAMRPPPRPLSPPSGRSHSAISQRSTSSMSHISTDSQANAIPVTKSRAPYLSPQPLRPSTAGHLVPSASNPNLQNFSRPAPRASVDSNMRASISSPSGSHAHIGHRRQHSQGFFEPSLPHASSNTHSLTASIAAQAAMHHLHMPGHPGHERKRSVPPVPPAMLAPASAKRVPSPVHSPSPPAVSTADLVLPYANGTVGGYRLAAATAAVAAFPRSPLQSPAVQPSPHASRAQSPQPPLPTLTTVPTSAPPPEAKLRERASKMKLFSKPKPVAVPSDSDKSRPPLPSPGRSLLRSGFGNASMTSLVDSTMSSASSLYSSTNASTSTLVPTNTQSSFTDKDKHRPHFLTRQKLKLKDATEGRSLPLSSASSNSQAVDPSAPQSLYSFTPQSPGASTFSKTMSGLDLRHGGRALREKKKEEKAAASVGLTPIMSNASAVDVRNDFAGASNLDTFSIHGLPSYASTSIFTPPLEQPMSLFSATAFTNIGNNMGLSGITPDDAWPLLKARLLNIFEGEDLRTPIEDFNLLVSVHIRRCVQKRAPIVLIEDLRELLFTGFSSLNQTLRGVPDDRLVTKVVEMWLLVVGTILPFIQAVFLPLDLEFKGHGPIMSSREAGEFWGAMPGSSRSDERPSSIGGTIRLPSLGETLDVRRTTLITFRDIVILPRHEILMAIFSRLSLDSIHATEPPTPGSRSHAGSNAAAFVGGERQSTAADGLSPRFASYNSQSSTLLDIASQSSSSTGGGTSGQGQTGRARATSSTSAGSFGTSLPHLPSPLHQTQNQSQNPTSAPHAQYPPASAPQPDPAQVTETVARMLQCVSIIASVQTGDQGQSVVERLTGALKYNWLGRGRTGRQRGGWVGMKALPGSVARAGLVGA